MTWYRLGDLMDECERLEAENKLLRERIVVLKVALRIISVNNDDWESELASQALKENAE